MIRIAQICVFALCLPVLLTALQCEGGEGDRCFLKKFSDGRIVRGAGESLPCPKKFSLERTTLSVTYSCTSSDYCNSGDLQNIVELAPSSDVCLFNMRAKREDAPKEDEEQNRTAEPNGATETNGAEEPKETEEPKDAETPKAVEESKTSDEPKKSKKVSKAPMTTTMSPKRKEAQRRGTESLQLGLMALFSAGMMVSSGLATAVLINHGMK